MTDTFGITYEVQPHMGRSVRRKEVGFTSMHAAKSFAGKEIHKPFINSVCAYKRTGKGAGTVGLYLAKNRNGQVVKREVNP